MQLSVRIGLAVFAAAMITPSAQAQDSEAPPVCRSGVLNFPKELAAWPDRTVMKTASSPADLAKAEVRIGRAVDAALHPTPGVHYVLRPEKPGGSVSYGGLYALTVTQAGSYRVALGSAAWIDMVQDGKAVVSTAHGHGPECSGIRKIVDFTLAPGRYVLQISANASDSVPLLVTRLP